MTESRTPTAAPRAARPATGPDPAAGVARSRVYDRRSLTYSNTFDDPWRRNAIRAVEWATGKLTVLRRVRAFERLAPVPVGQDFWRAALDTMGIPLLTPEAQRDLLPGMGPVIVVANHPHGLVDGMILAELIGCRRTDYRILTRSLLTGIDESAARYMIPVPFPHEPDAQARMLAMRRQALDHLAAGGVVALFPSGAVATSASAFGPAVEGEWNAFTAKLIRTSGATVVPVFFPGANSRLYQIANRISPTLRQGLLLHEVVHAMGRPQAPVVGAPIPPAALAERSRDPRALMAWLRARTLMLGDAGR